MSRKAPTAKYLVQGVQQWKKNQQLLERGLPADPSKGFPPESLTLHERKMVTGYLRTETNMTVNRIAEFLGVSKPTIVRYNSELYKHAQKTVAPYETTRIANWMLQEYMELKERARAKGDGWLEFKLISDAVEKLGKMGFIHYKQDGANIHVGDKTEYHNTVNTQITDLPADPAARREAIKQAVADVELLQGILNQSGGAA